MQGGHSTGQKENLYIVVFGCLELLEYQWMAMPRNFVQRVDIIRNGYINKVMFYFEK